jgi:hypothetical protein
MFVGVRWARPAGVTELSLDFCRYGDITISNKVAEVADMPDIDARKELLLRLPTDVHNTLRAEAFARQMSVNALITEILVEHVNTSRDELVDIIGRAANERFAPVLDKLAHL